MCIRDRIYNNVLSNTPVCGLVVGEAPIPLEFYLEDREDRRDFLHHRSSERRRLGKEQKEFLWQRKFKQARAYKRDQEKQRKAVNKSRAALVTAQLADFEKRLAITPRHTATSGWLDANAALSKTGSVSGAGAVCKGRQVLPLTARDSITRFEYRLPPG